jgi:hypothetical protein
MKYCKKCDTKKSINSFWKKTGTKDGLNRYCIECMSAETKKWFNNNIEWFNEYKKELSCIKCGFNHPAALDFHHRDPSEKEFGISSYRQRNKEFILKEIEKCDVLCSNCHRIEHYNKTH